MRGKRRGRRQPASAQSSAAISEMQVPLRCCARKQRCAERRAEASSCRRRELRGSAIEASHQSSETVWTNFRPSFCLPTTSGGRRLRFEQSRLRPSSSRLPAPCATCSNCAVCALRASSGVRNDCCNFWPGPSINRFITQHASPPPMPANTPRNKCCRYS